ncbi:tetratricopeptide repeat protein [Psychrobacter urativorans]|uniref:tetratricopeptide repeat protein n=1 Tax=Psychrobacter urativorans TaxID=45610 RepID=UPI00191B501D|nr:hypothetical protein [Psychrobacter urativorans]
MSYKPQVLKPSTEQEFETLCAHIYGEIYKCNTPAMYGRRGQKQYGLDVLVYKNNLNKSSNRIGIQCKHVAKLPFDGKNKITIVKEIAKADSGQQKISQLIIATSLPSDQKLTDSVNAMSDERVKKGMFPVEIQFWNDIENLISNTKILSERYYSNLNYSGKITLAKELFDKERYLDSIKSFKPDDFILMNPIEKYESYYILANCYYLIEQNDKFIDFALKLQSFEWYDEQYNVITIIDNIINSNADNTLKIIETYIDKDPDNFQYQVFKYLLNLNQGNIKHFRNLPQGVRDSYSIKCGYMRYYSNHYQFDEYDVIEKLISEKERLKPTYIILSIESSLLRYAETKSQYHCIEAELNSLESNLNINQIDVPSLKKYAINSIITSNCVINNEESVKHYYKLTKTTQCGILPETVINLVSFTKRNSDKAFFLKVYKDQSNSEIKKYLIDGLYHFGEMEELNSIVKLNDAIERPLLNEIKSFTAVNQLNDIDFSNFIDAEDLFTTNTLRGLALLGLKLYITKNARFEELNKIISSISTPDSDLKALLADYYFQTEQYKESSKILETLIDENTEEYLLIIQLESLMKSFQYQKAKHFIDKHMNNFDKYLNSFASLVNQIDNLTKDFSASEELLPKLVRFKNTSWYWHLRLSLSERTQNIGRLKKDINLIPLNLDDDPVNTCWIASYETQHSRQKQAVERIINLWRSNPANLSILTSIQDLLQSFMTSSRYTKAFKTQGNIFFDNSPTKVIDGCYISYAQESNPEYIFIDSKANFESSNTVTSPDTNLGKQFLNKVVGETFELTGKFGIKRKVEIKEILSTPLGIFRSNSEIASDANSPFNMVSFSVDIESHEGTKAFLKDLEQFTGSDEQFEKQLTVYQTNPVTLQNLSKFIGRDITEIIYGWTRDSRFPLRTIDTQYTIDMDMEEVKNLLVSKPEAVIDLFTLIELKRSDSLNLITDHISLYAPLSLLSELELLHKKNFYNYNDDKAPMTICSIDNKVSLVSMDINLLQARSNDLEFLIDYIESSVTTIPAYGDNSNSKIIEALNEFLPESDKAVIRLCQEMQLPLLSLDARLRALNHQASAKSINFYDYLSFLEPKIGINRIKAFNTFQFVHNRNCMDFDIDFIIKSALKNNVYLNLTVNKLLNHFSLTTDFKFGIELLAFFIKQLFLRAIRPTTNFIERIAGIYFYHLSIYNKLDFDNHKAQINSYFIKKLLPPPISINSVEDLNLVKENTLYIIHGTANPCLDAK